MFRAPNQYFSECLNIDVRTEEGPRTLGDGGGVVEVDPQSLRERESHRRRRTDVDARTEEGRGRDEGSRERVWFRTGPKCPTPRWNGGGKRSQEYLGTEVTDDRRGVDETQ